MMPGRKKGTKRKIVQPPLSKRTWVLIPEDKAPAGEHLRVVEIGSALEHADTSQRRCFAEVQR